MEDEELNTDGEQIIEDSVVLKERKRITFFGLPFSFTKYVLKSNKLVVRTGFFTTTEDEILLYRIMDTSLRRTFWQKIFGLGTIRVVSSDKSLPDFEIKNIRHYRNFKDELSDRIDKERVRMRTRTNEMVGFGNDDDDDDDSSDDSDNF